jgi:hypothetical protein
MKKTGIIIAFIFLALFIASFFLFKSNSIANLSLNLAIFGVILFLIGLAKEKVGKIIFPPIFHTIILWLRKILGFLILVDLVWVIIKAGLLGLYLWLMFFNVAIIFCLILLLTKRNSLIVGIILLLIGLFYCFVPLLPGPVLTMPMMKISYLLTVSSEDKILFIWIFIAKWLVLVSGVYTFLSAFIKKEKKQLG